MRYLGAHTRGCQQGQFAMVTQGLACVIRVTEHRHLSFNKVKLKAERSLRHIKMSADAECNKETVTNEFFVIKCRRKSDQKHVEFSRGLTFQIVPFTAEAIA